MALVGALGHRRLDRRAAFDGVPVQVVQDDLVHGLARYGDERLPVDLGETVVGDVHLETGHDCPPQGVVVGVMDSVGTAVSTVMVGVGRSVGMTAAPEYLANWARTAET
ncbi:hypothetical protein SFUMM280S_02021 [Streptomyces fumanus]